MSTTTNLFEQPWIARSELARKPGVATRATATRQDRLLRSSAVELARRSPHSAFVLPTLALLLALSTRLAEEHTLPSFGVVVTLALLGVARLRVAWGFEAHYAAQAERALTSFTAMMAAQNVLFSLFTMAVMLHYGASQEAFFALLFAAAVAAGGTSSLALRRRVHWTFLACALAPPFAGAALVWGPQESYFLLGLLLFVGFMVREGELARKSFTQLLLARDDLATAKDELEDRVAERTADVRSENEALLEEEARLRNLLGQVSDAVTVVDEQFRNGYMSPASERMLGYGIEERLGRSNLELIHPEDVDGARELAEEVLERPGQELARVLRCRHLDGSWRTLEVSARNLLGEPSIAGIVIAYRDVTEKRAAELALRRTTESLVEAQRIAGLGSWDWDVEADQIVWSDELHRMFGIERGDSELSYEIFVRTVHPDDRKIVQEDVDRALHEGEQYASRFRVVRPDGETRCVQAHGEVTLDEQGRPVRMVGTALDVTERERTAEEQRVLESRLRQAQKMEAVGQLAGGIAHDFNNSLTVVRGASELLLDEQQLDSNGVELLEQIVAASERAAGLTQQLLAFARKQVLTPKVLDLNAEVRRTSTMLERVIGEHIEIRVDTWPGLGAVRADPSQIEGVLLNLASNARDAMPGGGVLTLETRNVNLDPKAARRLVRGLGPGEYVVLSVRDTGDGIGNEDSQRIFEPFFTTKEKGLGTGLGLSTVHGVVEQSGGAITVESAPGEGTCFRIYLPRCADSPEDHEDRPAAATRATRAEKILLVEDEASVRSMMAIVLTRAGYQVVDTGNAEEALHLCDDDTRLLVTDVVMPKLDGRQLADRLCEEFADLKVLLVSGYAENLAAVDTPKRQFLAKPFSNTGLTEKVRDVLDG